MDTSAGIPWLFCAEVIQDKEGENTKRGKHGKFNSILFKNNLSTDFCEFGTMTHGSEGAGYTV